MVDKTVQRGIATASTLTTPAVHPFRAPIILNDLAPGAPGTLGPIGGHVKSGDEEASVLEATARRAVQEECGIDPTGVPLPYLESELFTTEQANHR